ncbi:MAG: hypothetical protein HYR73_01935 [Candidatus Eisenbacteria bacterium]|nr:hypothetical protein [Candidatus Eisenbacteria bacterium]
MRRITPGLLVMKIATSLLALALCAAFVSTASATVLVSESFTYPAGNLAGNGGWANYSGVGTDIQVSAAGRAVGIGTNQPDDHKLFTAQPTTSKTYACFEVSIAAQTSAPKPIYFAELKDGGTTNLVSRVYVLPISGGWTFGISHSSTSTTVGVTPWSAATLLYDTRYYIVINYDPVAHSSTLWVNPVTESSTSVTNTNTAIAALAVSGFGLRESDAASTLPASPAYVGTASLMYSVDNLGVGTTFSDACYQVTPARSSTWGQVKTIYR